MTVTAYASADPAPITNPSVDPEIDLAVVALPAPDVQLYGDLVDSADASPTKTFSWQILSGPAGHTASLDNPSLQNPKLQNADVYGNYLIALVATNTNTPESSQSDPVLMPSSARVVVRMLGANQGLQKFAPGERNWTSQQHDLVQAVEDAGAAVGAHTINSHSDVVNATGPELDTLRGGSYTAGLHLHLGTEVDAATTSTRGTVELEVAPLDVANPVVINRETITITAKIDVSYPKVGPSLAIVPNDPDQQNRYHAAFRAGVGLEIDEFSVALGDGGAASPATPYTFKLCKGNDAAYLAGTLTTIAAATLSGSPATDNAPFTLNVSAIGASIAKGEWLALLVEGGSDLKPARSLSMVVYCFRGV